MLTDQAMFRRFWAWQYDGTEASAGKIVASALEWQAARGGDATWSCPLADAGGMVLRRTDPWGTSDIVVPTGMWLICNGDDGPSDVVTDAFRRRVYRPLDELWDQQPVSYFGAGTGRLLAVLIAGGSTTVDCRIRPPLPAAALAKNPQYLAEPIVGGLAVTGAPVRIGEVAAAGAVPAHTLVRVTVQATGAAVVAGPAVFATVHV